VKPVPLVVDLDGTLTLTDTLAEGMVRVTMTRPSGLLGLLRGKVALKDSVAHAAPVDAHGLPWNEPLLQWIREEAAGGRPVILATGSHRETAAAVAAELGIFSAVIATENVNLTGRNKRDELVARFGERGFDYAGDSAADEPVFEAARIAHPVGKLRRIPQSALKAGAAEGRSFPAPRAGLGEWLRALRPHQWVKNVLVVVPTLLDHRFDAAIAWNLLMVFVAFSAVASGGYIVNDLHDVAADRRHPKKRNRPFASGALSAAGGVLAAGALICGGVALATQVSGAVAGCLITYFAVTTIYSVWLRSKPIIDVVVLALLYTLRLYTGGLATATWISPWLVQFMIFLFLSLAFVKRYSELSSLERRGEVAARGYRLTDMPVIGQAGITSGLVSALVLALYMNSVEEARHYSNPQALWGIVPLYVYWIVRVWLIAYRGNMREDPVVYAFSDKVSYIVLALIAVCALIGMATRVP
jgi:4-hydroxybenzoate polyprenyltransferase